ncbi:hypothetical protein OESDEN_21379, partial [Oesophagostomum dentatum]
MLFFFIFAVLARTITAGISDLNCTSVQEGMVKYSEGAVNCPNILPDKYCEDVFAMAIMVGGTDPRHANCLKVDGQFNEEVKQWAIKVCP